MHKEIAQNQKPGTLFEPLALKRFRGVCYLLAQDRSAAPPAAWPCCSSPVPPTIQFVLEPNSLRERVWVRFLFTGGSATRVRRAVNEQGQGITVTVVSCLLFCGIKFALFELGRPPIWLTGGNRCIRAYRGEPVHLWQGVTH